MNGISLYNTYTLDFVSCHYGVRNDTTTKSSVSVLYYRERKQHIILLFSRTHPTFVLCYTTSLLFSPIPSFPCYLSHLTHPRLLFLSLLFSKGYNDEQQQQQQQQPSTTISSYGGSQSFQLDATDPSTGKINIHLERNEEQAHTEPLAPWEARVEIHHGFRDNYGNNIQINSMTDEDSYSRER